jgi:hypothetical protein
MNTIVVTHGEYSLAVVAFGLLLAPVVHYLLGGWATKRKEILDSFTEKGIGEYFSLFFPARPKVETNIRTDFTDFYDRRFGRQHFIIPGVIFFAVSGFLIFFASWIVFKWMQKDSQIELDVPPVAVAAFVGAYTWVLLDLVTKAHLYDLKPTNLLSASFRLFVAAPLGLAVAAMLTDEAGVPIALFLGAFPTRTLTTIARRQVSSRLNLENSSNHRTAELQSLQGINRSLAERFEHEGVSTILQLAYSDPIVLTMRTNFAFSYVVDCCSQALAWLYFEDKLAGIRGFGLRGAQEIRILIDEIDDSENCPDDAKRARKCLNVSAAALQLDSITFEWVLRAVAEDPYTKFLYEIWCTDSDDDVGEDDTQE